MRGLKKVVNFRNMKHKRRIYLVLDNVRSTYNVGAMLRTAEGLGVSEVALCGYTPYPQGPGDDRPPYLAAKITARIYKAALGAEKTQAVRRFSTLDEAIAFYRSANAEVVALEQSSSSKPLINFSSVNDLALVVGNEIEGVKDSSIDLCDSSLYIPMSGTKESFNVASAAAMALFYVTLML